MMGSPLNNFFSMTELAIYRVLEDCPKTFLKKGQELPAYWCKTAGGMVEYIVMGISTFDVRYLDYLLWCRYLERADM